MGLYDIKGRFSRDTNALTCVSISPHLFYAIEIVCHSGKFL